MVTLHDGAPVPKVIDFGIAKAMHQKLTEKTLFTNYSQMIGTPAYMSPEQAENVDFRCDIAISPSGRCLGKSPVGGAFLPYTVF